MAKIGPLTYSNCAAARLIAFLEDFGAGDVRGHEVRGELDSAEMQGHRIGQGAHQQRLGEAGDADQQRVAAAKNGNQQALDHILLANNDPGELFAHLSRNNSQPVNGRNVAGRRCLDGRRLIHHGQERSGFNAGCKAGKGERIRNSGRRWGPPLGLSPPREGQSGLIWFAGLSY